MAQSDMNIANQGFPAFRSDLNSALVALVSNSSGSTAPSDTFAHQFWVDTSANPSVLKQRNADDDAWITIGSIDQTNDTFNLAVAQGGTGAADAATALANLGGVALTGNQTIEGTKTFSSDSVHNGLTVGRGAGAVSTNTAVGASALAANTSGVGNTAIGSTSLSLNTSANYGTAVGYLALRKNTTGAENTAFGVTAMAENTTGSYNVSVGRDALQASTTASNNTAVGYQASFTNQTGFETVAVGYRALYTATGNRNTAIGKEALYSLTTGTNNTAIGESAGYSMTTGSKNVIIGSYSGNQGDLDIRTASNHIVLSDGDGNPRYVYSGPNGSHFFTNGEGTVEFGGNALIVPVHNGNQRPAFRSYDVNSAAQTNNAWSLIRNGTQVGTVTTTLSATAYNTSSDYRLKEDVQPMIGATDRVKALKPVNFAWKIDGSRVDGFIAHEAQEVVPEAVTGTKDAVDKDGKPEYQGIDQSKLVPLLTAALQEAIARIEQLEVDVATLKGQP